jgi:hypothetical protein
MLEDAWRKRASARAGPNNERAAPHLQVAPRRRSGSNLARGRALGCCSAPRTAHGTAAHVAAARRARANLAGLAQGCDVIVTSSRTSRPPYSVRAARRDAGGPSCCHQAQTSPTGRLTALTSAAFISPGRRIAAAWPAYEPRQSCRRHTRRGRLAAAPRDGRAGPRRPRSAPAVPSWRAAAAARAGHATAPAHRAAGRRPPAAAEHPARLLLARALRRARLDAHSSARLSHAARAPRRRDGDHLLCYSQAGGQYTLHAWRFRLGASATLLASVPLFRVPRAHTAHTAADEDSLFGADTLHAGAHEAHACASAAGQRTASAREAPQATEARRATRASTDDDERVAPMQITICETHCGALLGAPLSTCSCR